MGRESSAVRNCLQKVNSDMLISFCWSWWGRLMNRGLVDGVVETS
jgi:hypothetical protein